MDETPYQQAGQPPVLPSPEVAAPDNQSRYVALMETNGDECESWYYFIRYEGNEDALQYLQNQLEKIEMYIIEDCSTFDLDLEHFVSETTAKQMTLLELNSVTFHRKFDGKLSMINMGLKKKDSNEKRIKRAHKMLGMGKIEDFATEEDIEEGDEMSGSSESDHEEDDDLIPLPISVSVPLPITSQVQEMTVSAPLSVVERAAAKRRKKKKKT